jgi:hypothetical protein
LWVILFGQMLVNLPAPWRILVRWSQEILAWYIASQSPAAWLPQRFAGLGIRERSQLWAAVYIYNYVYIYIYTLFDYIIYCMSSLAVVVALSLSSWSLLSEFFYAIWPLSQLEGTSSPTWDPANLRCQFRPRISVSFG